MQDQDIIKTNRTDNKTDFEQLASKTHFAHVIATFRLGNNFTNFIDKLKGKDKRNINATLLIEGLKINTYADSDWSGAPGVTTGSQVKKLVIFPADIGSGGFFAKSDLAKDYDNDNPFSTHNMSRWLKSAQNDDSYSYRRVRGKYSLAAGVNKMEEIAQRRTGAVSDYDDVDYYTINGELIKTSAIGRYTNPEASTDGIDNIPIKADELKHNESHITFTLADVENVFVTKKDLQGLTVRKSSDKIYNSREVLIYTAIKAVGLLNQAKKEAITNQAELDYMIDFEINKISYLFKTEEFLVGLILEFEQNLNALKSDNYQSNQDCEDLKIALVSKKKKFPEFDDQSKENKLIWLEANIRKLQVTITDNQSEIAYYQKLYQFENQEFGSEQVRKIVRQNLINQLKQEVELVVYDKEEGRLSNDFAKYSNQQSIQELFASAENDLLRPENKRQDFLIQLIANDFTADEVKRFFFENPNLNEEFKKQNLDFRNQNNEGLLHCAVLNSNKELVDILLLSEKVDINQASKEGFTAIDIAAASGQKDIVKTLLSSKRIDIDRVSKEGFTTIHIAAQFGHKEIVELLLLEGGPAVKTANKEGLRPIHIAAQFGHKDVVEVLLKSTRVDINWTDKEGLTPIHIAAQFGHKDVVEVLLSSKKVDINRVSKRGFTPIYVAAANGHKDTVELLLLKDADINLVDEKGLSPIHIASAKDHKEVVETLLLSQKVDFNRAGNEGLILIYSAAEKGHREIVEILLSQGVDPNESDKNGYTLLHTAALNGHKEVISSLIAYGAKFADNKFDRFFEEPAINQQTQKYSLAKKLVDSKLSEPIHEINQDKKLDLNDYQQLKNQMEEGKNQMEEGVFISVISNMLLNEKWLRDKISDEVFVKITQEAGTKFGKALSEKLRSTKNEEQSQIPSTTTRPFFSRIMNLFREKQRD